MSVRTTTFSNGLRVVTHQMPHLETVSLGVWAGVGARHETEKLNGVSHFLEHMAFKGTRRRTAKQIAEEVEARGGDLNAATSLETTGYHARVLKEDAGNVLDILCDILTDSVFADEEMERERDVIIQEIAGANDSPDELVYDLLQSCAYPDQPLGRTILGTVESVGRISQQDLRAHLSKHYHADALVVSAAGAVDHEAICAQTEALFGGLPRGTDTLEDRERNKLPAPAAYVGGVNASTRPFEQAHLVLGFPGPAYGADDFFAAQVFSGLFGGGMSSRLFQEVREKRGLCYSIYSQAWGVRDTGMLNIHAATGAELMNELIEVISGELKSVAEKGVSEPEVLKSKAQLKVGLLMGLESSYARAEQMARHTIAHGRVIEKEELIERVEAVNGEQIRSLALKMLSGAPSVAVVGGGEQSMSYALTAHRQFVGNSAT